MQDRPSAADRLAQGRALADAGRTAEAVAYLRAAAADLADGGRPEAAMLLVDGAGPTRITARHADKRSGLMASSRLLRPTLWR